MDKQSVLYPAIIYAYDMYIDIIVREKIRQNILMSD